MKIEVNIDKKILLVVLGIFLIGTGVYAAVNTSLPFHPAAQVSLNNGDSVQDYVNKMSTFAPGNVIIAHSSVESSFSGLSYYKLKEIQVAQAGTVNVSFSLVECGSYDSYGRIYLNGVANGTQHKGTSSSYRTFYENINVNTGDKVQLYVRCEGGFGTGKVKDFKIGVSNSIPTAVVTHELAVDKPFLYG